MSFDRFKPVAIQYTLFLILFIQFTSNAQITGSLLIRKLSINGVCLCNTTFSDLKQLNSDFKDIKVEEIDLPKNCGGEDARFLAEAGIYFNK